MRPIIVAVALGLFGLPLAAQEKVLDDRVGTAAYSCTKDAFMGHLVCVVLNVKDPFFGFQFGSDKDPKTIAFTVGYRQRPGTGADVKIDDLPAHTSTTESAFPSGEADQILSEIKAGQKIKVRFTSWDSSQKTYGEFDLKDFKEAIRRVDEFRARTAKP